MSKIDNVGQRIKGNMQQVKGKIESATGHPLKGKITQLRGMANVLEADVKMKVEDAKK